MADPPSAVQQEVMELQEFLKLLYTSFSGVVTALGAAVPLLGFAWQTIAPPWPAGSPLILMLASVSIIIILFLTFRAGTEERARRWSWPLWVLGVALAVIYFWLAATYIDEVDGRIHLTGTSLSSEAHAAVSDPKGPKNTTRDLLDYFGHDSEDRIWTGRAWLKWGLLLLACFASATFAGGVSLLLVATILRQKAVSATLPPPPSPPSSSATT